MFAEYLRLVCFVVNMRVVVFFFFFSSRRRHTRSDRDWSSDVCSSDLYPVHSCHGVRAGVQDQGHEWTGYLPKGNVALVHWAVAQVVELNVFYYADDGVPSGVIASQAQFVPQGVLMRKKTLGQGLADYNNWKHIRTILFADESSADDRKP